MAGFVEQSKQRQAAKSEAERECLAVIRASPDGISTRGLARCTKHTEAAYRTATDKLHFDGLIRREGAKRSLRWLATNAPVE